MRYLKVFLMVVILFFIMMLFVQNMSSFSEPVTLKFDPMFFPAVTSIPLPRYSLLLISFAIGAALVLFMLMWDRVTLTSRLSAARRRVASLEKKLKTADDEKEKLLAALENAKVAEEEAKTEIASLETKFKTADDEKGKLQDELEKAKNAIAKAEQSAVAKAR